MTLILLHKPIASSRRLERVHMFPGRHLGEEEFDREQDYADARLGSLLRSAPPGIVFGLDITDGATVGESVTVTPGLAVAANGQALGLHYPLRAEWMSLIDAYLATPGAGGAGAGIFYLLLRRDTRAIDDPTVDPCQRTEFDPTRDSRLVVTGTLALQRLAIDPAAADSEPRERIENWIAADRVDAAFLNAMPNAVPLALLAIGTEAGAPAVRWVSREAGRYEALAHAGYRTLLNQTSAALRRVMLAASSPENQETPLSDYLAANLHLDFLPAAGQLPLEWLQAPASTAPSLLWLPTHLGLDMVPVPEEAIRELIQRHLARRVIDLRHPAGDRIRLLLAVDEPDYRHDLLDLPQTDGRLEADTYRLFMRAHDAWRRWREQFDLLYYIEPSNQPLLTDPPEAPETTAAERRALDPAQFKQLGLPTPEPPPVLPASVFEALIARANAELQDPDRPGVTPYPYGKGVPTPPAFFTAWLSGGQPPGVLPPSDDGYLIRYAVALVDLEAIENQLRAIRSRLEKTRDFLLLQRQQLDSQTVALAALAGGVAGDGSGLQVARWLPYARLDTGSGTASDAQPRASAATARAANIFAAHSAPQQATIAAPKAFTASLFTRALTSSTAQASAQLANKPQTFSAFELGINKSRLELLARVGKETVSTPAFQTKEYRFGVIDHISPEVNEYAKAYYGMKELLATLPGLFDAADASNLRRQMTAVGQIGDEAPSGADRNPFERSGQLESPAVLDALATKNATADGVFDPEKRALLASQYRYHALFKAGKILTQWIALFETRYNDIERRLEGKLREQASKLAEIDKLAGLIRVARETLETLDRVRIEQLGDYGVAQRLLDEDWLRVYRRHNERTRILTRGLRGLYYVRVRATPVSVPLSDPLALRFGSARDIVPGCDVDDEASLPSELSLFFDAVCEIPLDDWASLKPLKPKLPPFERFVFIEQLRQARFKARPVNIMAPSAGETLQARLTTVRLQTQVVLQQWAIPRLPTATDSSLKAQDEAARLLSLEDLAGTAAGPLRKDAQALREQLEHCQACLLEKLARLPASIRLQWGQLAEDDLLQIEDVSWWPGLERAERDDFNTTRTVAELVAWWFRQLTADATANSRSAMRNMIRGSLIFASLGDPQEILSGSVHVPPRQALVGEALQLKLNRAPGPGTRLQLLDPEQRVVAILAVEDHSPQSTRARIVDLVQPEARITTRFSVLASKQMRML